MRRFFWPWPSRIAYAWRALRGKPMFEVVASHQRVMTVRMKPIDQDGCSPLSIDICDTTIEIKALAAGMVLRRAMRPIVMEDGDRTDLIVRKNYAKIEFPHG